MIGSAWKYIAGSPTV